MNSSWVHFDEIVLINQVVHQHLHENEYNEDQNKLENNNIQF